MADERDTPDMELYGTFANRPASALDGTFYYCTDTTDIYQMQTGSWVKVVSAGGADIYINAAATTQTVGGIVAGSTFPSPGKTMTEMWNLLLYPYQNPTFSSFLMTGVTTLEVGDSISGSKTFTWATTNSSNVKANSVDILDITGSATLETGIANSGSKAHTFGTPIQLVVAGSYNFRIQALNTSLVSFNRNLYIYWYWKVYYGESTNTSLTEAQIEALRVGGIQSGFAGTYTFVGGGYKYMCWPTALGAASSFKDASTGLNVDMQSPVVVSVTNAFSVTTDYYVYRTTYILGGAISIIVA